MTITDQHLLTSAKQDPITGGVEMPIRRCLVVHFTAGATAKSSIESMRERGLSAHLVIDRDGTIYQCRPFNIRCAHAGVSRWVDPKTGIRYDGLNGCSIGIELANAGNDTGALSWARKQPGFASIRAKHRNGGPEQEWESFYPPQLTALFEASKLLVKRYNLDDLTSHDCIAPERKEDVGPAAPLQRLREHCGFAGLPIAYRP